MARRTKMQGRDIHEAHRVASPLELLFDLTFVVAIAAAAAQLHHAAAAGHTAQGMLGFTTSFFAIWWAWMNFTWFASAYDTDDVGYRLVTMAQMIGVLVLAAGIPRAFLGDMSVVVVGYIIMRMGLVAAWLRAAREHPEKRQTCLRYVIGIVVLQLFWIGRLWLPMSTGLLTFIVLSALELAVPIWAARAGQTPWHAHHIAERYSLFTLIVLGECVLGASSAIAAVIDSQGWTWDVAVIGFGSVTLILSLWWIYFLVPSGKALHVHRERAFGWGYAHVFVFASLAALGAFLGVAADQFKGNSAHISPPSFVIALIAAAIACYLSAIAYINARVTQHRAGLQKLLIPCFVVLLSTVVATHFGLRLPYALLLLNLAPIGLIFWVERAFNKHPERFEIL